MTAGSPERVCVLWARFGPYHHARLSALHTYLGTVGAELVALEVASQDDLYAWDEVRTATPYRRQTLFPGARYEEVPVSAMHRAVQDALDKTDPDAVAIMSYSTPEARAALAWCRRRRRVAVMMFDSRREDAARSAVREWPKRQIVKLFDAALVAGTPHVAYAAELGLPRSHVFTPFDVVDNDLFADGAEAARAAGDRPDGLDVSGPYLLFVGRLTAIKNLPVLLNAYARYREATEHPWPLVIVGDGAARATLEGTAGDGVWFAGTQQIGELSAFYGHAGALVLPSWKDTWGLVVNEAMAAGLPVLVSTGAGCAPDLVEPGVNGWTFHPGDPAELAARLAELTALSPETRRAMGARSCEIVASFSPTDFAHGLWRAVRAGHSRSGRGLTLGGRAVLAALRLFTSRATSFHAIPD